MDRKPDIQISSAGLHVLAMGLMLCDHMWAMLFLAAEWLTCLGRLAFPIFAFLVAEGCARTSDRKKYALRMLVFALIAEIPFDLMYSGAVFYPLHQNVLWTFLLSILLIGLIDRRQTRSRPVPAALLTAGIVLLGFLLGYVTMVDYYGVGVVTVLVFYCFRGRGWIYRICQLVFLYLLNVEVIGGYYYSLSLFGYEVELTQQGLALLALIPIWLYRGRQGPHNRPFRYFCYAFYPAHMLILFFVRDQMLR